MINSLLRNDRYAVQKTGKQGDIEKIKSQAILLSRDNTDCWFYSNLSSMINTWFS